jgi:hypothetical protein
MSKSRCVIHSGISYVRPADVRLPTATTTASEHPRVGSATRRSSSGGNGSGLRRRSGLTRRRTGISSRSRGQGSSAAAATNDGLKSDIAQPPTCAQRHALGGRRTGAATKTRQGVQLTTGCFRRVLPNHASHLPRNLIS